LDIESACWFWVLPPSPHSVSADSKRFANACFATADSKGLAGVVFVTADPKEDRESEWWAEVGDEEGEGSKLADTISMSPR